MMGERIVRDASFYRKGEDALAPHAPVEVTSEMIEAGVSARRDAPQLWDHSDFNMQMPHMLARLNPNGGALKDGTERLFSNYPEAEQAEEYTYVAEIIRAVAPFLIREARRKMKEEAAKVAEAHKGQWQRALANKKRPYGGWSEDVTTEGRGEDIASEIIATAIRALPEEE